MKRIEISAEKHADDLEPLIFGETSQVISCTPAVVAAAVWAAGTWAAVYYKNHGGHDATIDQQNLVAPGDEELTVGDLLHVLRESRSE